MSVVTSPQPDHELARALVRVMIRLGRATHRRAREAGTMSMDRLQTLRGLVHAGPMRSGALAQRCALTPPAVSHTIDALVRDGLVRRAEDPGDRRAVVLEATEKGRRELARAEEVALGAIAEELGKLDAATRRDALASLTLLADGLDAPDREHDRRKATNGA